MAAALLGCLAVAALSLLVVAPAPSYDPWSWLLWGREIAGGELHTSEGPAFKPLPVAVCTLLSVLGPAAPLAWVLTARVGAVLAIWLAFRLARRLSGGSALAGGLAAVGVALCGAYLSYASSGLATGWLLALALGGAEAWRAGRPRLALACAVGCGLLQVESWPFLAALGMVLWRQRPGDRVLIGGAGLVLPALWLVPELLGSGDLLRSAARARIPNVGQPALADVPGLASLWEAVRLPLWPLWVGVAALATTALRGRVARRRPREHGTSPGVATPADGTGARHSRQATDTALLPAAAGLAWIAIVAVMAQVGGFSGEPRYALPGMALIAVSGAVGLTTAGRPPARPLAGLALFAVIGLMAVSAVPRTDDLGRLPAAQAYQWELGNDLTDAIDAAGGRDALLRCGRPYVGPLRGPLAAYRLDVPKRAVEPDLPPAAPGVVLRSRLHPDAPVLPVAPPAFSEAARTDRWQVLRACRR
ncbi:MAG TPA: hypothetical protein VEX36_02330 [Thermoleophilaceae bacterium]|nr:hypothetical protein [Thermoleophilaceae bacterium]